MIELISSNWVFRMIVLLAVFSLVTLFVFVASNRTSRRLRLARELEKIHESAAVGGTESLARKQTESIWANVAKRIEDAGLNLGDTNETEISKLLRSAGYRSATAPRVYTLVRFLLIFALPGLFLLYVANQAEAPSLLRIYFTCAILAILGLYVPNLVVRAQAESRRREIINGFPDSLDLMLVCVEAGLGLEAALDRIGRETARSHPLISEMITETTLRMRAGANREDALRLLGETAGVDEIRSFTTLLIQSDKLGTSLATTLRVYSSEMREARRLRAEEKAHRLPVLISIPLVAFMLPAMIGALILPAATLTIREVIPSMTGGG
ncbi:type II secretion system F family protein [Altererythrobacter sp. BO-6]|uniref:type II secretion system F family protein n=1 Tax=Altererythrobacter sp. BO-6 TaxID=2604537 RepID=UPI0013E1C066|nr:type II secretion system F family protein [Altererythrobacter sp. BO-6]QIG55099.1 type II secretion system F family protein [Altererythrobacter sp. BO-6]